MKANELRIGNWIFDRQNRLCKVEEISNNLKDNSVFGEPFKAPAIYGGLTSLPHKPIPLTEDILLKCKISKNIRIEYDYILECHCVYLEDNFCLNNVKLYYLHQLQNLYFALTGEELTINL